MSQKKSLHNGNTKDLRMRQQLAQEAARIIAEEGINDFHIAKQKAAERLHAPNTHNLPRNNEIQQALNQHQRLFRADSQPQHLHQLRLTSRKAMAFLESFKPRLVGAITDGSADEFSSITLHLFTDTSEEVSLYLIEKEIPYELSSRRLNINNGDLTEFPAYLVSLENIPIELIIFPQKQLHHAPRDPISGKPMQRLGIQKLDELIQLASD